MMNSEQEAPDAYETVLADLRAKRDQIDAAIQALELIRGSKRTSAPLTTQQSQPPSQFEEAASPSPGMFLGLTIADAAIKLLSLRKRTLSNSEIAAALQEGGIVMKSNTDPINIVGSVLTRRFAQIGDVVRVGRGTWGLKEWYPHQSFKPRDKEFKASTSEPERPSEQIVDDLV